MSNLEKELGKIKSGVIAVLCENTNDLDSILTSIKARKAYNKLIVYDPDNQNTEYKKSDKLGEYFRCTCTFPTLVFDLSPRKMKHKKSISCSLRYLKSNFYFYS